MTHFFENFPKEILRIANFGCLIIFILKYFIFFQIPNFSLKINYSAQKQTKNKNGTNKNENYARKYYYLFFSIMISILKFPNRL